MRRLREEFNHYCECGHVKRQHEGDDYSEWCMGWNFLEGRCNCQAYKQDNLRYLEAESSKKEVGNNGRANPMPH